MNDNIPFSTDRIDQVQSEKKKDKRVNRSTNDRERDRKLYKYLLTLTENGSKNVNVLGINYNEIAEQWGMLSNRMFVQRVVQSISVEIGIEVSTTIPGITLNKLVHILSSIDKYRQKQCKQQTEIKFPRILTRAEKLRALRLYAQTLPEEQKHLELKENDSQLLLQKLVEDISDPNNGLGHEKIIQICKYISNSIGSESVVSKEEDCSVNDSVIANNIEKIGVEYFKYLKKDSSIALKKKILETVKKAIKDIEYQNGSYQLNDFLNEDIAHQLENIFNKNTTREIAKLEKQKEDISMRFGSRIFIEKLTKTIIENQILTEEFPVHLKYIEIQEIQESILQDPGNNPKDLNRLFAYTVKVYFYVKDKTGNKEEFYEEVTGVGSPLAHAIAAMNRALLWDIKSLKKYIPIAKQIAFNTEIIGSSTNGSVWANYVVSLCKRENINIEENSCPIEEPANGEYCGFDTLEVYAKASFYARLRAIKKTGISADNYIEELRHKIKQVEHLRTGEKLLNEYPFSLEAMRFYLTKNLLNKCHKLEGKNNFPDPNNVQSERWSLTEYEAHLSIAESYLKEGLYEIGEKYLSSIENHIKRSSTNPISKVIIARYHLCYFRYHYLTDLEDYNNEKNLNRSAAVANANMHLDEAYKQLKDYVYKCNIIDELPYVNFYNFYTVLSKLYAHRGKLYFFMSYHLHTSSISDSINLFEKARMYAARSGNSSLYSMWSAYQSWCYLISAYTDSRDSEQNYKDYINKAEKILIHALQSYEKIGKKYYESIKLKSGKENQKNSKEFEKILNQPEVQIGYEEYDGIKLQGIPLIKEFTKKEREKFNVEYSPIDGSLSLDMSLLTSDLPDTQTLLFGTQSSLLLFAIAMLKLCHYKYDDISILAEIETAKKMFAYSWSFAEEGLSKIDDNNLDRWTKEKDPNPIPSFYDKALESQCLSGLYPHRITQFADFGKIYFIGCELILMSYPDCEQEKIRWNYIDGLLTKLKENHIIVRKNQTGQKRYNGHLQEHFQAIDKYVNDVKRIKIKTERTSEVRDEIVMSISNILRTGQRQVISDNLRKFSSLL
jgi:hypothetical protein